MSSDPRSCSAVLAVAASLASLGGCTTTTSPMLTARTFNVGPTAEGDPCRATRTYDDVTLKDGFDASFVITCRTVTASRSVGVIRSIVKRPGSVDAAEATLSCGAATAIRLGSSPAYARHCYDRFLRSDAVTVELDSGDRTIIGSAAPTVAGPLMRGMLAMAGRAGETMSPAIDLAALAPPPTPPQSALAADFDPHSALLQAIAFNRSGRHIEASRIANDALSRLSADASQSTRAELSLEAALADSNIRFAQTATEHFARADSILANPASDPGGFLKIKRDTYKALDLLNRGRFQASLDLLNRIAGAMPAPDQPLADPALVAALNQPSGQKGSAERSMSAPNARELDLLLLRAQANRARSVALFELGDLAGANRAIEAAAHDLLPLQSGQINPAGMLWMQALLDRQGGRLAARSGNWAVAQRRYDSAIAALRQSAILGGAGAEPAVAQLLLDRAAILERQGLSGQALRTEYQQALDALLASGTPDGAAPAGLAQYLDLLVREGDQTSAEEFFRAVQAVNKPAIERQMSRIRDILQADPRVGAKLRDKADLERQLTSIRYQLADLRGSTSAAADLEGQRSAAQARLTSLDAELASDPRLKLYDQQPATIREVQTSLRPDEAFFKLTELAGRDYGILITHDKALIYRVAAPARDLRAIATRVRASIDGHINERRLVPFDVAASYALFRLVAGPAAEEMRRASALIVDPAGPLERLPAGVLVTDQDSVRSYRATAATDDYDFSKVSFLAAQAELSMAVSPRSFLISRALPPSHATKPFIGFAEHEVTRGVPGTKVEVGSACYVDSAALRALAASAPPIPAGEVQLAARALGIANAPVVTRAAFSDTALESRTDLADYAILHFATHGLEEGVWGCLKSPPALLTSFGDANSDGLLSIDEIARLRLDANLVVLAACDTGAGIRSADVARLSGQEESGSTLEGLVRAFLTANARAVLATHWEVPVDDGTPELMEAFYTSARTTDLGSSLRAAQRQLIRNPKLSHPFYWGAYFLFGDARKSAISNVQLRTAAN